MREKTECFLIWKVSARILGLAFNQKPYLLVKPISASVCTIFFVNNNAGSFAGNCAGTSAGYTSSIPVSTPVAGPVAI